MKTVIEYNLHYVIVIQDILNSLITLHHNVENVIITAKLAKIDLINVQNVTII